MREILVKKTEQDRVVELMCQILELKESSEIVVKKVIKERGMTYCFNNINDLSIDDLEKERIKALKEVINKKEEEIVDREGVEHHGK